MDYDRELKSRLKARLPDLVDVESLRRVEPDQLVRRRTFGHAMLVLSVLVAAAGHYIPSHDGMGRAVFLLGALLYGSVGAWSIDRASRLQRGKSAMRPAKP